MNPNPAPNATCPKCGHPVAADAQFCDQCGQSLAQAVTAPPAEAVPPAPATTSPEGALEDSIAPEAQVTPADAKHAEKLLERASAALQRGDYAGATVAARQSLSLVPSATGQLLLSNIMRAQGNAVGARQAMEQARLLAGEDGNLLKQVDRQAALLTPPATAPAPLAASLDVPVPPVVPAASVPPATAPSAKPEPKGASFVASLEPSVAPQPVIKSRPLPMWKYALVLVTAFVLMFCTVYAIRRRAVAPPAVVNSVETVPAPEDQGTNDTDNGDDTEAPTPAPAAPEAPANSEDGQVSSPQPAPTAVSAPAPIPEEPRARPAAPAPVNRPVTRPRPAAPETAAPAPAPVVSQGNPGGTSSGNGMLRVPSALPTPVAVDSPQVPTIRTPRP